MDASSYLLSDASDSLECCEVALEIAMSYQSASQPASPADSVVLPGQAPLTPLGQGLSRTAQLLADEDEEYSRQLHEQEESTRPYSRYLEECQWGITPQMRGVLVDWLVEISFQLQLSNDSLFLAVACMDRYLSKKQAVPQTELQLTALACLWAAAKYEEAAAPRAKYFLHAARGCYSLDQLINMEAEVLRDLEYRLTFPTIKTFLRRYMYRLQVDRQLYFLASYMAELCLLEYRMLAYMPSAVAAAAYAWAMTILGYPVDNVHLVQLTGYSLDEISECIHWLASVHAVMLCTPQYYSVRVKYAGAGFECVSMIPLPAMIMQAMPASVVAPQSAVMPCFAKGTKHTCTSAALPRSELQKQLAFMYGPELGMATV